MTIELFRDDSYLKDCNAIVQQISVLNSEQGLYTAVELDQTVCYPMGGGQPGDHASLSSQNAHHAIADTRKSKEGVHWHFIEGETELKVGDEVSISLDWARRYRLMRAHSCMHMLCAVIDAPVTGGSIRDDGTARLDFDMPEPPDKLVIEAALNEYTQGDYPMRSRWISDDEMKSSPELVRTMSVSPPKGQGQVRLVEFVGADMQACGGTHVANASEIGSVTVQSIKKKGKQNRRITVMLS